MILECTPSATLKKLESGSCRDAHVRNAWEIYQMYKMPLIFSDAQIQYYAEQKQNLDYVAVSYGSFYAPHRACNKLMASHPKARLFWITNEVTIMPPGYLYPFRRHCECIANYESKPNHGYKKWHFLNLNTLMAENSRPMIPKKYSVIYYGTYRVDRLKYFRKYLQEGVYLSTNPKNHKKFKHIGTNPSRIGSMEWTKSKETLNLFKYSLYIEDEGTHTRFNHLANRFYEALFCNCVTLFDRSCQQTIRKSGIPFNEDFYVDSHEELMKKVNDGNWQKRLNEQKKWLPQALKEKYQTLEKIGLILAGENAE